MSERTDEFAPRAPAAPAVDARHDVQLDIIATRTTSRWTVRQRAVRVLWTFVQATLFRWSFHNMYAWRRFLLRAFGAKVGRRVLVRPTARIEIPWQVDFGDDSAVGDFAILYSLGQITLGRLCIVSQYAHLCAGTHDHRYRTFPLLRQPITIGEEAWIAADAFVGPGVSIGDRAIVGARAVAMKNVPADEIWAGNPAKKVKMRQLSDRPA